MPFKNGDFWEQCERVRYFPEIALGIVLVSGMISLLDDPSTDGKNLTIFVAM